MNLLIKGNSGKEIPLKKRHILSYSTAVVDEIEMDGEKCINKDFICLNVNNDFSKKLESTEDEEISIYLIENMLLIDFLHEEEHYVIYNLPLNYIHMIKESQKMNFLMFKNKALLEVDYYFVFDKIREL